MPRTGRQAPMQRADHAEGERLVKSERITDREGKLADFEVGGGPNSDWLRYCLKIAQADHGEIIVRRGTNDICRNGLAGGKPDGHVRRTADHMVVGDDIAGAIPDK